MTDGNLDALERHLADREAYDEQQDMEAELQELRDDNDRLAAELADANNALIAFGSGVMVQFAKDRGLPDGHLLESHYDILAKAGARMDSFKRGRDND